MKSHANQPNQPRQDAPDPEPQDLVNEGTEQGDEQEHGEAQMQGEGNYEAARRHRESAERFVDSGQVERAAREAEPRSVSEDQALRDAEAQGRAHAKS